MTAPLAYTTKHAAELAGMSERSLIRAIHAGELRAKRRSTNADGAPAGRRLILAADLQAFLDGLVDE